MLRFYVRIFWGPAALLLSGFICLPAGKAGFGIFLP
jgi:hypothetical protein